MRQQIISMTEKNLSLKQVAEHLDIKHENVRRIYWIYRAENRVHKKTQGRARKARLSQDNLSESEDNQSEQDS